jgi:3-hydroxyacyl-[acyl-carrier-protein] dehydratase
MSSAHNDLFSIKNIAHEDGIILAVLRVNPDSEILKGHFPGHPVIPGACMLQTLKEVLEMGLDAPIALRKAASLKFMRLIDPLNTETVLLDIIYKFADQEAIEVIAKLSTEEVMCFKFQGSFMKI